MLKRKSTKEEVVKADKSEHDPPKKRSKPQAKAKDDTPTEPYVDAKGWNIHPPSLIYKSWKAKPNAKIAAFDLDGTLVVTKGNAKFARSADDWKFFNKKVVSTVQHYVEEGFQVVVFSNQNGIKSKLEGAMADKVKDRVEAVISKLLVPAVAFLATGQDEFRKPETGMWKFFTENMNGGKQIDLKSSFFVGDAAGRDTDFAASDKEFAEKIGIQFKTPEDVFGEGEGKKAIPAGAATTYNNVNEELVTIFNQLADTNTREGKGFQARAFKKVADVLSAFPKKVDNSTMPEVKKLQGVGKGSLSVIQEWLTTGKVEALGEAGATVAAAAEENKAATVAAKSVAMKFM